jgi:hypothetical protein
MAGNVTTQAPGPDALLNVALRLDYLVGQITPEEFRWQDANFDRDSALGRELLFLIANNEWARASAETIDITRSDTVETTIKIDVDLSRITHEAFRGRTGQLWLPVLVLPPLRQRLPEPDPFATLTVADADGSLLATLPNADVRHRAAAALAEIIVNIAVARLPDVGGRNVSASRDQRLLLSAALYRLLRSEHVPSAVMAREVPPRRAAAGPVQRIGKARRELAILLDSYASLLTAPDEPDGAHVPGAAGAPDAAPDDNDPAGRSSFARRLTERAIQVLRAVAESAVVVVAADLGRTPTVLTVTVPSRALHQAPRRRTRVAPAPASRASRWLRPVMWNWILPRARLQIDLLLPSADADRQVQVNLPDGVSFDPSRPIATRAELDITSRQPLPVQQLPELMRQLMDATQDWPPALYQGLADLAGAKTDAAREALRDHRVGAAPGQRRLTAAEATRATREFRERLDALSEALADISAGGPGDGRRRRLAAIWAPGGDWLQVPMRRRTSTDTVSPDVVVARARMIEDVSQRAAPTAARIGVHIAVTDSEYFSIARFAGWMSVLLMAVVLGFFGIGQLLGTSSQQVSPEVLAFVLTLFTAVQAGRMERPDRSTMRGLLAQSGNVLIGALIVPTMVLAAALAFSRSGAWAVGWALGCITVQLFLQGLLRLRLWLDFARGRRAPGEALPRAGLLLHTDAPDYSHGEVLHSGWWRATTADALLVGRPAYGYVVWQHGPAPTLGSLLHGGRPAIERAVAARAQASRLADRWRSWRPQGPAAPPGAAGAAGTRGADGDGLGQPGGRPGDGPGAAGGPGGGAGSEGGTDGSASSGGAAGGGAAAAAGTGADAHGSLLEQPANVLALQRSGTIDQSLTFAVFRDEPKADWDRAAEDVTRIDLDPSQLGPVEEVSGVVGVFLGLGRDAGLLPVPDHPVTAVLRAAASARNRLNALEVQLPVPAPAAAYAHLQWARVQIGLRDGDIGRLASFLTDMQHLSETAAGGAARPVVGVQTVPEGIPRILNPPPAAANPGPAADQAQAGRLVLASDLDVVTGSGLHRTESATAATWRVMAICADWRSGVESEILAALDPGLDLAGLTTAVLHGKSVVLLLGHRPGGRGGHDQPALAGPGRGGDLVVYLDAWQSRKDLGEAREHPLLRVHMRTPDRAGATLEVLESLRATLQEMAPGVLGAGQWKVWYTRTVVAGGNAALIQLTVRLAVNPATTPSPDKPIAGWGPAEFSRIERRALALAASKMAASAALAPADAGLDAPEDTVISVGLMTTPDLQPDSAPAGASASC